MKNDNKIINLTTSIASIMLVVFSISFIFSLVKVNLFKISYIVIIGVVIFLINLLLIIHLNNKTRQRYKRYISVFVSTVFIFLYLIGITYVITTFKFVDNLTKTKGEYQTYSVVVLKSSPITKIKELNNKKLGFINTNENLDNVKVALSKAASISVISKEFDDNAKLYDSLTTGAVDANVYENNYLELLKENNESAYKTLKVIYKFKVKVKKVKGNPKEITKPFSIYISGSDSRGKLSDTARSDVNIVMVVNPKENKVLLVSIPRDYYVQLHGTSGTKDKLTHAGIYGVNMSKNTISDLLNVDINYYLKVGFSTVITSVDLLGGIDIDSDKAFNMDGCTFVEGTQHLDGKCALAFSRARKVYETGDRHRGENQEQVITKMIDKFTTPGIITKYSDILNSLSGSFETNMSYTEITNFIKEELLTFNKWSVESISLDGTGDMLPTYSMGSRNLYVMIPDETTVQNARNLIEKYLQN